MGILKENVSIHYIFGSVLNLWKDCVFPVFCLGCDSEGEWLCENCFQKLDLIGMFCCPICHNKNSDGSVCLFCKDKSCITNHIAITEYKENKLIGKLIHAFKYQFAEDIKQIFKKIIDEFCTGQSLLFQNFDLVVPVPLHKKRFVERGFNQAYILAQILGSKLVLPVENCIKRKRNTAHQAKLSREKRLENVKDAFVCNALVSNKRVIVVDDVFTTGTTIGECAKALRDAGAREVVGFSIARG